VPKPGAGEVKQRNVLTNRCKTIRNTKALIRHNVRVLMLHLMQAWAGPPKADKMPMLLVSQIFQIRGNTGNMHIRLVTEKESKG